jgi:hypothetical protein
MIQIHFVELKYLLYPCGTTKAQANGKLSEQTSIFIMVQMSNGLHCHKESIEQKRVFSVGSFFDTFLAVQKSMPNAYNIATYYATSFSLPYTTTKAQANGKLSEPKSIFIKASKAKWDPMP